MQCDVGGVWFVFGGRPKGERRGGGGVGVVTCCIRSKCCSMRYVLCAIGIRLTSNCRAGLVFRLFFLSVSCSCVNQQADAARCNYHAGFLTPSRRLLAITQSCRALPILEKHCPTVLSKDTKRA